MRQIIERRQDGRNNMFGLDLSPEEKKVGLFMVGAALLKNWLDEQKEERRFGD